MDYLVRAYTRNYKVITGCPRVSNDSIKRNVDSTDLENVSRK